MKITLILFLLIGRALADVVPVPGTQPVAPIFARSDLVCNCVVESIRVSEEQILLRGGKPVTRRHIIASTHVNEAYNREMKSGTRIKIVFDEEVPSTSGSMPAVSASEQAIIFLRLSGPAVFEFADPFLGVTPFSAIPIGGNQTQLGLMRLETALAVILESHNHDDQINALRLLQGFDELSSASLTRLETLSASSDEEVAISAIAVLVKTKSPESVRRLVDYLSTHGGSAQSLAVVSIGTELGRVADPEALTSLENLASSRYVPLRLGALAGIRNIKNPKSAGVLVKRLDDPDTNVRYLAVITLSEIFTLGGEYSPTMYLFDQNPDSYTQRWKSWWIKEGHDLPK